MILRVEELTVESGTGLLDVRGSDFDAGLIISGKFAAYQCHDCTGSVAQHLIRASSTSPHDAVEKFRQSVTSRISENIPLSVHFADVLSLLVNGRYRIELEDVPVDAYIVELKSSGSTLQDVSWFYPDDAISLVSTQPACSISPVVVERYLRSIECGERPVVVTASAHGAWSEFIIDGHHKLAAYLMAAVPIRRLALIRLDSPQVALAEVLAFLPEASALREHLRRNKSLSAPACPPSSSR